MKGAGLLFAQFGLGNWGNGWCPFYQDTKDFSYGQLFSDYAAPSTATNAIVVAKPVSNSQVHLYVQFQDANGRNAGKTFDRTLTVGNRPSGWNRYYRFASLIPRENNAVSNDSDETYMIGAKFTNTGIYNGSSYVRWGTTGSPSLCEVAWVELFPKITPPLGRKSVSIIGPNPRNTTASTSNEADS